jgi:Fe-S-cluster containining protein
MIEAFKELHRIQKLFGVADSILQSGIGVSTCINGCGKCCMVNTPVWKTIEAINAVSVLTGIGKLREAVSVAEGWLSEPNQLKIYEGRPTGLASPQLREEWLKVKDSQCLFLKADLTCMIHECRPISCRAFAVTHDGMPTCDRPPGKGETLTQHKFVNSPQIKQRLDDFMEDCKRKPEWLVGGFVPTLLYRAAEPEKFKKLILDNRIPSARIVGVEYEVSLYWQPQIEALRAGVSPDLVSAGIYQNLSGN